MIDDVTVSGTDVGTMDDGDADVDDQELSGGRDADFMDDEDADAGENFDLDLSEDMDVVATDNRDFYITGDTESLELSEVMPLLDYIGVTNTCIAFGIFFLVGLLLAKITWGRLK